jgi:hypothetical protein
MKPESKRTSASIPPEVREKIIRLDRDEKAKRQTKRPQ